MSEEQNEDTSGFLMGGGVPSAKFEAAGDSVEGYIVTKRMTQQTDFKTGEPLTFQNGDKRMQLVLTLATEERDDEIEDDDGSRRVYVKFKLRDAVAKACKAIGVKDVEVGGYYRQTLTGTEKPRKRGEQGAKLWEVEYTAPTAESQAFLAGSDDDAETAATPPPAKKAAAKKAPPKPPAPEPVSVDEWVEDDTHTTGEDGTRWVWDAEAEDWTEWVAPRKAPAKKAAPKAVAADPGF